MVRVRECGLPRKGNADARDVDQNRETEIHSLGAELKRMQAAFGRVGSILAWLLPAHPEPAPFPYDVNDVKRHITLLTDQLIAACVSYSGSDACHVRATKRVVHRRHPSPHPGKQEQKDCVIFEEFLELTTRLREGGLSEIIVFVTPNKNDYGDPINGPIAEELAVFGARYVSNLAWACDLVQSRAKSAP